MKDFEVCYVDSVLIIFAVVVNDEETRRDLTRASDGRAVLPIKYLSRVVGLRVRVLLNPAAFLEACAFKLWTLL